MKTIHYRIGAKNNDEILENLTKIDGVKTQMLNGNFISVRHCEYTDNPLKWDIGINFLSTSDGYFRGEQDFKTIKDKRGEEYHLDDFDSPAEVESFFNKNDYIFIRVWIYEHSGIALNENKERGGVNFDFGYLYISRAEAIKLYSTKPQKRLTAETRERALKNLRDMMESLNYWLEGEIYEATIFDRDDEIIENFEIWGYCELDDELKLILQNNTPQEVA